VSRQLRQKSGKFAKSSEKALVKRFCEKNFTEFLARVEKMVSVFYLPPCAGSVQKQDFVNNQALAKRTLIFTLFRKTQNTQQLLAVSVVHNT